LGVKSEATAGHERIIFLLKGGKPGGNRALGGMKIPHESEEILEVKVRLDLGQSIEFFAHRNLPQVPV
jgi:hypothetical protein